jgi:cyclase
MSIKRIIPILLTDGDSLFKTTQFKNPKYVGDPINAIKIFNEKEIDEIAIIDIFAQKEKRNPNFDLIQRITNECFMPLLYGGGVKTLADFEKLFHIGVEKVLINRLIFENPKIVKDAIGIFGSQSIVASLDLKKSFWFKDLHLYNYLNQKIITKQSVAQMLEILEHDIQVGEIFLNFIDQENTWCGLNIDAIKMIRSQTNLPLIVSGGANSISNIEQTFRETNVDAIGLGAMSVYQGKNKGVLINFPNISQIFNKD